MSSWWKTDPKDGRLVNHKITPLMRENHPSSSNNPPGFWREIFESLENWGKNPLKSEWTKLDWFANVRPFRGQNPALIHVVNIPFI